MAHRLNREFVVTFLERPDGPLESKRFMTMKHFSDWFNSREPKRLLIYSITEKPGDECFDIYFKGSS